MNELLAVFALICVLFYSTAQADTLSGRVVRVIDGDTLVVLDASKTQQKIRLQGIDATERKQAFGTTSKEHLSDLVAGQVVVVVDYHDLDRYQRIRCSQRPVIFPRWNWDSG